MFEIGIALMIYALGTPFAFLLEAVIIVSVWVWVSVYGR